MKIASHVIKDLNKNKITAPKKKVSSEIKDTVNISSGKEEIGDDSFTDFLKNGVRHVVDYTKLRPTTGADSIHSSATSAALSGGITGIFSGGGNPVNVVGGAVGGAVGIKVGEKTEDFGKAVGASFAAGAIANTAAVTGIAFAQAAMAGASLSVSPVGLALIALVGGLSGVSGTMQGGCMGDVKDGGSTGMILGATAGAMTGNPLLTLVGSLAGASGGLVENKAGKYLTSAGTGAVLGAATGAMGGPVAMAINAAIGAGTGVLATAVGPKFGQVQRNATEDIQKFFVKIFKPMTKNMGIKGRTAVGTLGGAISAAPMGLLFSAIMGPAGAVIPIVVGGALTGYKVNKTLKNREKIGEFSNKIREFFNKTMPKEQAKAIPKEIVTGFATLFAQKYEDKKEFDKLTPEQFINDITEFERQAAKAASQV